MGGSNPYLQESVVADNKRLQTDNYYMAMYDICKVSLHFKSDHQLRVTVKIFYIRTLKNVTF
jgi:hypothetical protein